MGVPRGTTKLRYAGFGAPLHDARTTITFDEHPNQDTALAPKQDLYFGIGRWLTYGQGDLKRRGRVGGGNRLSSWLVGSKGGMTLGAISRTGCRGSGTSVARPATAPGAACTIATVIALSAFLFAS